MGGAWGDRAFPRRAGGWSHSGLDHRELRSTCAKEILRSICPGVLSIMGLHLSLTVHIQATPLWHWLHRMGGRRQKGYRCCLESPSLWRCERAATALCSCSREARRSMLGPATLGGWCLRCYKLMLVRSAANIGLWAGRRPVPQDDMSSQHRWRRAPRRRKEFRKVGVILRGPSPSAIPSVDLVPSQVRDARAKPVAHAVMVQALRQRRLACAPAADRDPQRPSAPWRVSS